MTKRFKKLLLAAWAFVGAPGFFATLIFCSYWYASMNGHLPFINYLPEWLWFFIFGICLFTGFIAVVALLNFKTWIRLILGGVYLLAMSALLLFVHLKIAFSWGDSL